MLSNFNQSTTVNAISSITTETGEIKNIMYMNASISVTGNININQSTQNAEEYLANKETVDADFTEFQQKVTEIAKGFQNTGEE